LLDSNTPQMVRMDKWIERLTSMEDKCIEIDAWSSSQIFDFGFFGTPEIIELWEPLLTSPIMRLLDWSDLVLSAIPKNQALGQIYPLGKPRNPPLTRGRGLPGLPARAPTTTDLPSSFPGLLAMHVRRGDYEEHCQFLSNWSSGYMGLSRHPDLPDQFTPPPGGGWGENTPENKEVYRRKCWPTISEIVQRVKEVLTADEAQGVERLFVLTNGEREWVAELKAALGEMEGMKQVTTSRDLVLTWEQKYIAQAVDMAVAERAQMFIGNGWSSMTTNILLLRSKNNNPIRTNRFW